MTNLWNIQVEEKKSSEHNAQEKRATRRQGLAALEDPVQARQVNELEHTAPLALTAHQSRVLHAHLRLGPLPRRVQQRQLAAHALQALLLVN